jgi:hypothetical protein
LAFKEPLEIQVQLHHPEGFGTTFRATIRQARTLAGRVAARKCNVACHIFEFYTLRAECHKRIRRFTVQSTGGVTMSRVRSLEGWEAGLLARIIQRLARFAFGCELNPIKVQAHFTRGMVASFVSNAILDAGRCVVGKDLLEMARIRVASRNGCPF